MIPNKEYKALKVTWVPMTPAGTACMDLERNTRQEAIDALIVATAHMPYGNWAMLEARGYKIYECHTIPEDRS